MKLDFPAHIPFANNWILQSSPPNFIPKEGYYDVGHLGRCGRKDNDFGIHFIYFLLGFFREYITRTLGDDSVR